MLLQVTLPFTVDGSWSPWGTYSVCSATCSGGKKVRFRTCTDPPPQSGGKDCIGPNEEQIPCNTDPCPGKINNTDCCPGKIGNTDPCPGKIFKTDPCPG